MSKRAGGGVCNRTSAVDIHVFNDCKLKAAEACRRARSLRKQKNILVWVLAPVRQWPDFVVTDDEPMAEDNWRIIGTYWRESIREIDVAEAAEEWARWYEQAVSNGINPAELVGIE